MTVVNLPDFDNDMIRMILMVAIPFIVLQVILMITGFVSIAKKRVPSNDKIVWIILMFVNLIGPIIYFAVGSNRLDQKAADYEDMEDTHE